MVEVLPGNGVQSTLNGAITAVATALTIQSADIAAFPPVGNYRAVLNVDPAIGPWEIVTVTGGQGTANLTVSRASEPYRGSQTAYAWANGATITPVLTHDSLAVLFGGSAKLLLSYDANTAISAGTSFPSGVWTNFGPSQTFNVDDPNAVVEVAIGGFGTANGSTDIGVAILIDGTTRKIIGGSNGLSGGWSNPFAGVQPVWLTGLSVGTHTVQVQVYPTSAATTIYCRPDSGTQSFNIRALQIGQGQGLLPGGTTKILLSYSETADLANNTAFAGATWINVGTAKTFTITEANALIQIVLGGYSLVGGNAAQMNVNTAVLIDGTTRYIVGGARTPGPDFVNILNGNMPTAITGLSVGNHTLQVQFQANSNGNWYLQAATNSFYEFLIRVAQISQNPALVGVAAKVLYEYTETADRSITMTNSATWYDWAVSHTFTVDDPNALIEVDFGGFLFGSATGNHGVGTRVMLDGVTTKPLAGAYGAYLNFLTGVSPVRFGPLPVGNHTVKVQLQGELSGEVVNCRAGTRTAIEMYSCRIAQISQGSQPPAPQYGYEVILTAAQPSVTLPISGSFPPGFRHLRLRAQARGDAAATQVQLNLTLNGDNGANYDWDELSWSTGAAGTLDGFAQTSIRAGYVAAANSPANYADQWELEIPNYSAGTFYKSMRAFSGEFRAQASGSYYGRETRGTWRNTAPITSLTISAAAGNFVAGSTFTLILEGTPVSPALVQGASSLSSIVDTPPLVGNFTWVNQGNAVAQQTPSPASLAFSGTGSGENIRALVMPAPATPYTVTMRLVATNAQVGTEGAGFCWRTASSGILTTVVFLGNQQNLYAQRYSSPTAWSSDITNSARANDAHYLRVGDDGVNRWAEWSINGVDWVRWMTIARADNAVPDQIGLMINPKSSTIPNALRCYHWAVS